MKCCTCAGRYKFVADGHYESGGDRHSDAAQVARAAAAADAADANPPDPVPGRSNLPPGRAGPRETGPGGGPHAR